MTCPRCRPFVLQLAERAYVMSTILGRLAERRVKVSPAEFDLQERLNRWRQEHRMSHADAARLLKEQARREEAAAKAAERRGQ